MGQFKEIALPLIARGIPVIPLRPRTKVASYFKEWEKFATADQVQVELWDQAYPNANCGSVAKANLSGFWYFEVDRPEVAQRIQEATGQNIFNLQTFKVRSRPGRGHFYFKQNAKSISMGNIGQNAVKFEDWSARVDDEYVVSPGSWHPESNRQYELISDAPIIEAPDWLINWCPTEKVNQKTKLLPEEGGIIATGSRNSTLASLAGKARHRLQMDEDQLFAYLMDLNRKQCRPPLDEGEVRTIAASIARYPIKDDTVYVRGVSLNSDSPAQQAQNLSGTVSEPEVEIPEIETSPYPNFPHWVMTGTSIYEGFVKPVCDVNSRYPEFMWMPAMVILMNYLALKVTVNKKRLIPSFFMVLIGMKGRLHKSASVEDAFRFFNCMGVCEHGNVTTRNAEGKSLIFSPGSPEGLGIEMQRTQCKNSILFYDEFMTLVNKAGIDTSDLVATMLKLYESGKFSNVIKARKDSYSHDPGTYCASFIANTTDKNFIKLWNRLLGNESSGLKDRFFFLYQPQFLKDEKPFVDVNFGEGVLKTRKLVDKALEKKVYSIANDCPLDEVSKRMDGRQEQRVERLALAFAVDLDRDEIDEDCIERAIAIIDYERAVKKHLRTFETLTAEAQIQMDIIGFLMRSQGLGTERDLDRALHLDEQWGSTMVDRSIKSLALRGKIQIIGKGVKGDPRRYQLLWTPSSEEEQ